MANTPNPIRYPHADAALLARFEAARAAVRAHHTDNPSDRTLDALVQVQDEIALELARAPCASSDEFVAKEAYLLEWELADEGGKPPTKADRYGFSLVALHEYLKRRREAPSG